MTDQRKNPSRFIETLQTYLSIVSYYSGIVDKPKPWADEIANLHGQTLRLLDRVTVDQLDTASLKDAIPVLEMVSKTEADVEKQELAGKLLVRFVRQARINEGLPSEVGNGDAGSVELYGMKLDGSPIMLVRYIGDITDFDMSKMAVEKDVRESLGDLMRSLPGDVRFNCCWAGHVDEDEQWALFDEPQAADAAAKQEGLAWVGMKTPGQMDESHQLGEVVETLVEQTGSEGIVVLILLDRDARIKQETVDKVSEADACPRVFIVSRKQNQMLLRLAEVSKGGGVTLKAKGGLMGMGNIVVEAWPLNPADAK